MLVGMITE